MANNKDTAVAKVGEEAEVTTLESALPAIVDENIVDIAEQAEKRLDALQKIKEIALKVTNYGDWVNEGGKPYLQGSGAQKIARVFGVSWRVNTPVEDDLGGGHYLIRYTGEFALSGAVITETGSRSSKDPFFSRAKGRDLPASEIDKGNVTKAAYTNLLGRGIQTLLGLRNLTWADLDNYAGVKQTNVASVGYGKPSQDQSQGKAPSSSPEKKEAQQGSPDDPATLAQAQAIHSIFKNMGVEDELSKMQKVAEILGLKEVPTAVASLTKFQASTVIAALQKEQKEAEGGGEGE